MSLDTLDAILHISVQLAQLVNLVGAGIPVSSPVGLEEGGHQLPVTTPDISPDLTDKTLLCMV